MERNQFLNKKLCYALENTNAVVRLSDNPRGLEKAFDCDCEHDENRIREEYSHKFITKVFEFCIKNLGPEQIDELIALHKVYYTALARNVSLTLFDPDDYDYDGEDDCDLDARYE